ncbi:MAG: hypothetical protein ABII12_05575 [Planctomycetota bacterium]
MMTEAAHPASDEPSSRGHHGSGGDEQETLIELVPPAPGASPKVPIPDALRAGAEPGTEGQAIPSKPQHVCPTCDYLLTGLTSRRCPECGECFTLSEARTRALQMTVDVQRLQRKARRGRWLLVLGIVMASFGILWPWHSYRGTAPPSVLALTPRGYLMLIVTVPVSVIAFATKCWFGRKWWEVVFAAGLVMLIMGLFASTR